ncbi:SIR2 family protein [Parvibaculum sp.]|uniref:SIR2 family protein n=1 Tax=Parvibaculum sp. TaxID=2024848 RepID=UPI002633AD27|nr:SIR2 family protein [Parvibaculum sp.]MCW5726231.1 SIR2 family protein [Parvibaculum sp.]
MGVDAHATIYFMIEDEPPMTEPSKVDVVVRGGQPMKVEELPGHLALALRLENVGVFLGAGASVPAGGKTMKAIWSELLAGSPATVKWLRDGNFLEEMEEGATPNIEAILGDVDIALHDAKRRGDAKQVADLETHGNTIRAVVVSAVKLHSILWDERKSEDARRILEPYHRLLARLQGSRQPGQSAPWVFTTNYDLSIEWAAEALGIHVVNGFSGLHDRRFQPNAFDLSLQNTQATGEARFGSYNLNLVKLHGSLSWMSAENGLDVIERSCDSIREDVDGFIASPKSSSFDPLLIQPTAAKYVDTVGFVYGEMIRRLTEFLSRSNTTLIVCGYSFGDNHLNRLIASGLLNPTLQLIIYTPEWGDVETPIPNTFLEGLRLLGSPRIIIRGGGEAAYLDRMSNDLPDPAMVDELSPDAKRMLSNLAKSLSKPELPEEETP